MARNSWLIKIDDLSGVELAELLNEHLEDMRSISPPESKHALDIGGLRQPDITFWTIWEGDELAGCGALKELSAAHGEIKSMRTAAAFRRRGVAAKLLQYILEEAARLSKAEFGNGFYGVLRARAQVVRELRLYGLRTVRRLLGRPQQRFYDQGAYKTVKNLISRFISCAGQFARQLEGWK